ncbi:MAG: cytochrome P450 [Acidimicrobiales bacterium]|jgi:pulcherriminic acid synthase|nr:cytochrome P450 [Acidimicrobiales bacterium]MDP6298770.1 cytochrome P450 [Acidimicrobiales bacterium]HJM98560.1 cytochrome P450 [Acidimicrobiales bacterium]
MEDQEKYEIDEEPESAPGYRTYEVYQRERVGETTNLIKPRELISDSYLHDPYPLVGLLRENYPCYRDWLGNRFWITRYDDVTSVFTDDRNYQTRTKTWFYGLQDYGKNLWNEISVQKAFESNVDEHIAKITGEALLNWDRDGFDLAVDFCAEIPLRLWGAILDISDEELNRFVPLFWRMQRGSGWNPIRRKDGLAAVEEMEALLDPIFSKRRNDPSTDFISAIAQVELTDREISTTDLVVTILELDHETLHGGLSNLWFNLLQNPDEMGKIHDDPRMLKYAWLETLRYTPPVLSAKRFTKTEVERFGRLLPEGSLMMCSAAAANRDPRQFNNPDTFIVGRKDLCQREPRGQYRADGLPSGISFGLGKPSIHPAVPKERPRSLYAIVRDCAVTASSMLLEKKPNIKLIDQSSPELKSLLLEEIHTCWELKVSS